MSGDVDNRAAWYGLSSRVRVRTVNRARRGLAAQEPDVRAAAALWAEAVLATAAAPSNLAQRARMWVEIIMEAMTGPVGMAVSGDIYGTPTWSLCPPSDEMRSASCRSAVECCVRCR